MNLIYELLYKNEFNNLTDSYKYNNFYVSGGRGIGKTTLLLAVKNHFETVGHQVSYFSGFNYYSIHNTFSKKDIAQMDQDYKYIIFDDFDRFTHMSFDLANKDNSNTLSFDDISNNFKKLFWLSQKKERQDGCFIASGLNTPADMINPQQTKDQHSLNNKFTTISLMWSTILSHWDHIILNPWKLHNWADRITKIFTDDNELNKLSNSFRELWIKEILHLTEGHPTLLAVSILSLKELLNNPENALSEKEKQIIGYDVRDDDVHKIKIIINDYLTFNLKINGLDIIKKSLYSLLKIKNEDYIKSYINLYQLAKSNKPGEIQSSAVQDILLNEGLIYQYDIDLFKVPGTFLCEEIIRTFESFINPFSLIPSSPKDATKGILLINLPNYEKEVFFQGSTWKILECLFNRIDNFVSVEEIQKFTQLDSKPATRSAIQRLETKLNDNNLGEILISERGRGYKLNKDFGTVNNST